jgi:hypothetical protein
MQFVIRLITCHPQWGVLYWAPQVQKLRKILDISTINSGGTKMRLVVQLLLVVGTLATALLLYGLWDTPFRFERMWHAGVSPKALPEILAVFSGPLLLVLALLVRWRGRAPGGKT